MVSDRGRTAPQTGYSLVFLIVLIALFGVLAAATLPDISKQIQREKEAELIFRGLQYAEAIRVFQQRFGRYPNTLAELIEVEPRSIRQLWTDPMTSDGRWAFILASGPQAGNETTPTSDGQGRDLAQGTAPSSGLQPGSGTVPQAPVGPILGVVSRKKGLATRTFMGKDQYTEWRFTANILPVPQVVPGTDVVQRANVENLGKSFPRGLQPVALVPDSGTDLAGGRAPDDAFADEGADEGDDG